MPRYNCPRCETTNISFKDKYKTSMWGEIYCNHCKSRLCAYPVPLALIWVAYAWDVAWFSGLYYYTRNPLDFVYMVLVWLMLDAINITYMPLAVMKTKVDPKPKP
jgi:hypothetical protein